MCDPAVFIRKTQSAEAEGRQTLRQRLQELCSQKLFQEGFQCFPTPFKDAHALPFGNRTEGE